MGGVLNRTSNHITDWERVRRDIDSYSRRGDGIEENKRIEQVLDLSYYDLPHYLKPCFLYIGCAFPEDQNISVEELYKLLTGEGMVLFEHQGREESLMDVAERYLNELVYRNLVQVQTNEVEPQKRYESCRLHDLVRDLCLDKSMKEDFRIKFMEGKPGKSWFLDSSLDGIRRLSIRSEVNEIEELGDKFLGHLHEIGKHLRSLSILVPFLPIFDLNYVKHLKLLKVLILEGLVFRGWKRRKSLESIFKLVNLKYLSFCYSIMDELPRSISNLRSLVILDLRLSSNEVAIGNVIWRMTNLKQLYLPEYLRDPKGQIQMVGQLDKLEVLHGVDSGVMDICSIITHLKNLRDLSARVVGDHKALSALIVEIKNMHPIYKG